MTRRTRPRSVWRFGPTIVAAWLALLWTLPVLAASETPVRIPDQAVYDLAGVFGQEAERSAQNLATTIRSVANADVIVISESVPDDVDPADAVVRAATLRLGLKVGDGLDGGGLLVYVGVDPSGCSGQVELSGDEVFGELLRADAARLIATADMQPLIESCDLDSALLVGMSRIATAVLASSGGAGTDGGSGASPGTTVEAGPPFPDPVPDVAVYDHAGIFGPETIAGAETTIDAVEERTGAEVTIYTQVVEEGRTTGQANDDARSLMDEWHVGRKGFDDGLVIIFDMYPGLEHGQVILYGGTGFRATFLDNGEKQRIYEDDMLPRLRAGDFDGALIVALQRVDEATTPEHAETLQRARQVDALAGLVVAPILAIAFVASAAWSWLRFGRDPVYLDDPSIHMAGPPEALTPAGAVFVLAGGPSRRALTTALLDLASRGALAFRQESHLLGLKKQVGIETQPTAPEPETRARQLRNAARDLGPAEELVEHKLQSIGGADGYIEPEGLLAFGTSVPAFNAALETEAVARGWFREKPSKPSPAGPSGRSSAASWVSWRSSPGSTFRATGFC